MGMIDALLPEFDREAAATRQVLERLPADRLAWKPHEKSRSLGELAAHVSVLPAWAADVLTSAETDIASRPHHAAPASKSDLLAAFDLNVASARAALAGRSDPELLAVWSMKRNGRTVFTMPKAAVLRSLVLNHLIHHRAQLGVYLRLLDVAVPALYGPSADEPAF